MESLTNTDNPCLDVLMSVKEPGTPIQGQNCNASTKQKWQVEETECPDLSFLTEDASDTSQGSTDSGSTTSPDDTSSSSGSTTDSTNTSTQTGTQTQLTDDCCTLETSKCLAC
jgi:hypothetical protein